MLKSIFSLTNKSKRTLLKLKNSFYRFEDFSDTNLSINCIYKNDIMFIAKKLKEHSTIESLNMELSSIGVNGAKELSKALQHK